MSKVLVILPTLGDRLEYLRETLDSVRIQRSEVELTLAVVSPARATEARALALEYGAVLADDPGTGISAAINAGLALQTDETYYAWIGDDDLFRPNGLSTLVRLIEATPPAVVAYGGCEYITPNGRIISTIAAGRAARWMIGWGPDLIPHPGSIVRLDALISIGGFDTQLKYAMDLDMFLKLRRFGSFRATRTVVSAFRWHPDSLTVSNRKASSTESEFVKARQRSAIARVVSPMWVVPIRWASARAAATLSARARRLESSPNSAE